MCSWRGRHSSRSLQGVTSSARKRTQRCCHIFDSCAVSAAHCCVKYPILEEPYTLSRWTLFSITKLFVKDTKGSQCDVCRVTDGLMDVRTGGLCESPVLEAVASILTNHFSPLTLRTQGDLRQALFGSDGATRVT
jgi:hypothetical protein